MKARILRCLICLPVCLMVQNLTGQTPSPPETGPFSVQMFIGGTTSVYLALNPPTTFTDGTPIPAGTPVTINIYRSLDRGATYTTPVQQTSGADGHVGQGGFGSREKPWIDITAQTPVDNEAPYVVYLAATCVVNGVESPQTVANLTFIYYPELVRLSLPSDAPGNQWNGGAGAGSGGPLAGTWTINGQGTMTINHEGSKVSGTISAEGQQLGTISGTFESGEYRLRILFRAGDETMDARVVARVAADRRSLTADITADGQSWQAKLVIEGRNLRA